MKDSPEWKAGYEVGYADGGSSALDDVATILENANEDDADPLATLRVITDLVEKRTTSARKDP